MSLTEKQKELLRWIVEQVRTGTIREEYSQELCFLWNLGDAELSGYYGSIPDNLTRLNIDALESDEYFFCEKPTKHLYRCILKQKAYEAVDSNFAEPDRSTPSNPPQANLSIRKIKIFLASSSELKDDRDQFEIFIRRKNDELIDRFIYLQPVRWENFIDAMSAEGLQEEYNKAVAESDIFVSLFYTKVGQYTEEEFSRAFGTFQENNKPLVYTYFQEKPTNPSLIDPSLHKFKEKLKELKHYPTYYHDINDLKHQFGDQLVKILPKISSLKA